MHIKVFHKVGERETSDFYQNQVKEIRPNHQPEIVF